VSGTTTLPAQLLTSVAVIVTLKMPGAAGVPVILRWALSKVNPPGRPLAA